MRYLLYFTLPCIFSLSCKTQIGERSLTKEFHIEKALFAKVQKFSDSKGEKADVYLIDMIHYAPESFYWNVGAKLAEIRSQYNKTAVLEEGVGCEGPDGWIYKFKLGSEVDALSIAGIKSKFNNNSILNLPTEEVDQLVVKPGFFEKTNCDEERKEKILEVVNNFKMEFQVASQLDYREQIYQQTEVRNADVNIALEQPWVKLLLAVEECVESNTCSETPLAELYEYSDFKSTLDYFQVNYRNMVLMKEISGYKNHYDALIIPWGSDHHAGLAHTLENDGYSKTSEDEIYLGKCSNLIQKKFFYLAIEKLMGAKCFNTSQEYDESMRKVLSK